MLGTARKRAGTFLGRATHPRSWPVRWRLAAVSSGLTLLILVVVGGAVGQITTQRIRDDFNEEVKGAAEILSSKIRIIYPFFSEPQLQRTPQLESFVLPDDASVRIYNVSKEPSGGAGRADLGPLQEDEGVTDYNGYRVATVPIFDDAGEIGGYVQYGRSLDHVESTINRVWFLIFAGILGGTLLASLAGVAVASRAMRPVSSLTATAREIAMTRDPSQRMPRPPTEDEVGELAATLDQMLRSLDAARSEREAAMQRQREFVADASHELRTPLTSVLANLELLQTSLQRVSQSEEREIVDSALRSSKRMNRLVGDLLLLARADAGRLGTHRPCDLAEIAGEAAAEAAALLGDRRLTLDNDKPLIVEGSADELHRLVLNLLDNAAHHTPPGSHVELALRAEGEDAVIEVADDGPGIPAEMRDQVFERFVRGVGPADTAPGAGTGLGLAIVAAVVSSHGGEVEVAESQSGGALFRARIPLAAAEQPKTKPLEAL